MPRWTIHCRPRHTPYISTTHHVSYHTTHNPTYTYILTQSLTVCDYTIQCVIPRGMTNIQLWGSRRGPKGRLAIIRTQYDITYYIQDDGTQQYNLPDHSSQYEDAQLDGSYLHNGVGAGVQKDGIQIGFTQCNGTQGGQGAQLQQTDIHGYSAQYAGTQAVGSQ